ncbi:MAG TPA: pentapeptide repeat-containing protein, partial [Caulobacteraceae bacterium]|nr:pentapeptide repeat-containing protein [Caulobacteraceae bacterium]
MSAKEAGARYRRLSQQEVDAVCARHDRLWASLPGGARAVFAWADLSGLDLSNRNLCDADFSGAILAGANFSGARLEQANFFGADMQGVNLAEASLRRADLRGACLRGADLSGADLFEADLREGMIAAAHAQLGIRVIEHATRAAEAQGASLVGANLERSRLSGIIAMKADFTDAVMRDCKLVRANLKQATLRGVDLAGADLSSADLSGCDMRDAVLVGAKTGMWRTDGADLTGALTDKPVGVAVDSLPYDSMLRDHALWCETGGREGSPSVFDKADLRALKSIRGLNLTALSAKGAVFYG